PALRVDLATRTVETPTRTVQFERLISTLPFAKLLALADVPHDPAIYTYNKVEVFNLGFDGKGPRDFHWLYYPGRDVVFYRVGFYDNIFGGDRMSAYVEIGRRADEPIGDPAVTLSRVLADLARVGIITEQRLVAHHHVVLDPAYVHITR